MVIEDRGVLAGLIIVNNLISFRIARVVTFEEILCLVPQIVAMHDIEGVSPIFMRQIVKGKLQLLMSTELNDREFCCIPINLPTWSPQMFSQERGAPGLGIKGQKTTRGSQHGQDRSASPCATL